MGSGEEEGGSDAGIGDAVTVSAGDALDLAVEAQAAQLIGIGHCSPPDRFGGAGGEGGEMMAQIGAAEAVGEKPLARSRKRMSACHRG